MNQFDCGSIPVRGGFLAFYRMVHHSKNFILRDGKHDIIFATEAEAKEAARVEFLKYLNSPISGMASPMESRRDKANALFRLPASKPPKVVKQRDKCRPIEVVRIGAEV